jgi:hypothetical protein
MRKKSIYQLSKKEAELIRAASDDVKAGNFVTDEEANRKATEWLENRHSERTIKK